MYITYFILSSIKQFIITNKKIKDNILVLLKGSDNIINGPFLQTHATLVPSFKNISITH